MHRSLTTRHRFWTERGLRAEGVRSRPYARLTVAILAALTLPAAACGTAEPATAALSCGVVVDTTSFAANTDVQDKIRTTVPRFLNGCSTVGFGVVTGVSGATDCRRPLLRLEPTAADNPQDNPRVAEGIRAARRKAVITTLDQLAECGRQEKRTHTGSDILGALDLIARGSAEYGRLSKILIISDMVEHTRRLNLYRADISTTPKRTDIIRGLRKDRTMPDLKGTKIYVLGFGLLSSGDPARLRQLREFWNEAFTATGSAPATYL